MLSKLGVGFELIKGRCSQSLRMEPELRSKQKQTLEIENAIFACSKCIFRGAKVLDIGI